MPAGFFVETFQKLEVRAPRCLIDHSGLVRVILVKGIRIYLDNPFCAGVLDKPIIVPIIESSSIVGSEFLGVKLVHIKEIGSVADSPRKPLFYFTPRCVYCHFVIIPIRHNSYFYEINLIWLFFMYNRNREAFTAPRPARWWEPLLWLLGWLGLENPIPSKYRNSRFSNTAFLTRPQIDRSRALRKDHYLC